MKIFFKGNIILLMVLFCVVQKGAAQFHKSKAEIISIEGNDYTQGITSDEYRTEYITYERKMTTQASGNFNLVKTFYFLRLSDGREVCHQIMSIYPATESYFYEDYFNEHYEITGKMEWNDNKKNLAYKMTIKSGLCIIMVGLHK